MKKIIGLSILCCIISIVSCQTPQSKFLQENDIIYYGTKEFEEFEKNAPIKLHHAWEIQKKFALERNELPENWLFFVINNYYVFNSSIEPKQREVFLKGIWVNAENAEILESDSLLLLEYKNGYNGDAEKFLF
ncbi:hypothetical protein ACYSNX_01260 [Myroides sp. LJL115]